MKNTKLDIGSLGDLKRQRAEIDLAPEEFRRLGHDLVDRIAELYAGIGERPVTTAPTPVRVRELVQSDRTLPDLGADPGQLLSRATELLFDNSLFNGHPRFWGYITSSAAPLGMLGDLLAAAVNPNVGAWKIAPIATEIERQTIRWIAELLGYPTDCGGLLVSGGNMANFVGFLAARAAKIGEQVRTEGIDSSRGTRYKIYTSKETHTWIQKAADLFGLGTNAICWIPTDDNLRMDMMELRHRIETDLRDGHIPFLVIGTAGSVSTGAIDPLPAMADLCREFDLWFHVDGAYGAPAAAVSSVTDDIRGLARADSVAMDPHKWLYAPLEAGCALVRNEEALREAFSYHPAYYHFGEEATNFVDFGPQNSRGFRALKVWLTLQQAGRKGYERMIGDNIRLAEVFFDSIEHHPELERYTLSLSIATFRYVPADLRVRSGETEVSVYLNELNEKLLAAIEQSGEIFVSNAIVRDRFLLRLCVVNFRSCLEDIASVAETVCRHGSVLDTGLRPDSLKGR
jgi:glutamate/tyrosine decarboxylase-like PLP-dependent enzyme